eukprot:Gb_40328 [translate_table: standard]
MVMSKDCHVLRKRARDSNMAEHMTYESKLWRDWLAFLEEYLLNQTDELDEDQVANGDRLWEIMKSLHDEIICIPSKAKAEFMDTQILNVHEADAMFSLQNSIQGYSVVYSDCYAWDLKASQGGETFMPNETSVRSEAAAFVKKNGRREIQAG